MSSCMCGLSLESTIFCGGLFLFMGRVVCQKVRTFSQLQNLSVLYLGFSNLHPRHSIHCNTLGHNTSTYSLERNASTYYSKNKSHFDVI